MEASKSRSKKSLDDYKSPYTVRSAGLAYRNPVVQRDSLGRAIKQDGEPVIVDQRLEAMRGEHIMLTETEGERLLGLDAVVEGHVSVSELPRGVPTSVGSVGSTVMPAGGGTVAVDQSGERVPLTEMDDEELVSYLKPEEGRPPSVDDVENAAGSDPSLAARLLDAEDVASGGEPRKSLVEKLERIRDAEQ